MVFLHLKNQVLAYISVSTIGMTTGKWYCEFTKTGTGTNVVVGIHDDTTIQDYLDRSTSGYGWRSDGVRVHNDTQYSNIGSYDESNIMGLLMTLTIELSIVIEMVF